MDAQRAQLIYELNQLKKLIFGSKSERFVPTPIDENQGSLFADEIAATSSEASEEKQIVTHSWTVPKKTKVVIKYQNTYQSKKSL